MNFKKLVKAIPFLGPFLHYKWRYHFLSNKNPTRLLKDEFKNIKQLFLVQVGSNDGKTGDPLYYLIKKSPGWKGLFIEPVPFLFNRLKKNYASKRDCFFENVAIGLQKAEKNFFYVDEKARRYLKDLPEYFDQLNTFNKEYIIDHFGSRINDYIICEKIMVEPFQPLLDKYKIEVIDLLHIDTEGYDWIVLQQLDFYKYKPKVILFEHKNLSANAKQQAIDFLKDRYEITDIEGDFYCRIKQ
jgi:FkbM family methyltransferase